MTSLASSETKFNDFALNQIYDLRPVKICVIVAVLSATRECLRLLKSAFESVVAIAEVFPSSGETS
jgi:hypothetical protein